MHLGYLEHYVGHQSSYWVQALTRDKKPLPVAEYTGTLTIEQTTMDFEATGEVDVERSAYLFTIGSAVSLELGTHSFTATASDGTTTFLLSQGHITIREDAVA